VFKLQGNSLVVVPMFLEIPKDKAFRGKTYFYLVKADILEQDVPTIIYFRLAIKTEK
jgi:hypothetical protein